MINEINNNIINNIIYLINRNYFLNINNLLLAEEKKQKELTFLQRKREEDQFILKIKNNCPFQKEINFSKSTTNEKIGNIRQQNESRNARNGSLPYPINLGVNNCNKIFGETSDNLNLKESNKINTNTVEMKASLINMDSINNNSFTKKKYFNVIKNINKKCLFDLSNNNEIKVIKNKKEVYIDRYFLHTYSNSRALKTLKKSKQNKFVVKKKTTSKYRGVSKNGNKWQVIMMINNKKYYKGSYISEEFAARVYDILSIKNRGIKARTNFIYNNIQKKNIYESKINIKSDNISDIIKQLTN